ncbi:hypothetical protein HDU82_000808 [Entophlyctis luteolus]|nr:hypothetical protein HDU82_000808 [Entophlyctis luteolus]
MDASFVEEPLAPPKPAKHPRQQQQHMRRDRGPPRPRGIDPTLVVDPRLRDALGISQSHTRPAVQSDDSDGVLQKPVFNSSLVVMNQLAAIQNATIDSAAAVRRLPHSAVRKIQTKLTKTLNVPTNEREYEQLTPVSSSFGKSISRANRVKISVDEAWIKAKNEKPANMDPVPYEEKDVVDVPFPKLSYTNARPIKSQPGDTMEILNPRLKIASFALNFDDSHCERFFDQPIRISDL